jgi:DNA-binding transcriptional LysR family regulator
VATVDTGSVGRAALRLNLTQPAISRRIQRLEEDLGVVLLDRVSKPAKPTRAGESAYRRCVAVLRATEILRRETQSATDAGPLRIGLSHAICDMTLAAVVEALHRSCPDIQVRVTTDRSITLRKQVADGALDAAVVAALPERPIDDPRAALIGQETVVVVAPRSLTPRGSRIADYADLSWVINPEGCGYRSQLEDAMASVGRSLQISADLWGMALQIPLIANGVGLGLLPERAVLQSPLRDQLQILDVKDFQAAIAIWLVRSGPVGPLEHGIDVAQDTVAKILGGAPKRDAMGT